MEHSQQTSAVLIVGAGPAGVSAALHLERQQIPIQLISMGPVGGLLHAARCLDNLPGFPGSITGPALALRMKEQLAERKISVWLQQVVEICPADKQLKVGTATGKICSAAAVILATGTLPVALSADWLAVNPHRTAATLPVVMAGEKWLITGGGDAAADTALSIHDRGGHPFLFLRSLRPCWHDGLALELKKQKIPVFLNHPLPAFSGLPGGGIQIATDNGSMDFVGVVCCHGRQPVVPDCSGLGSESGVFIAGDADGNPLRYASRAMASGIEAAERVRVWLREWR